MELFFDLVYVLAVTQLSQLLMEQLSVHGAGQSLLLLLAVWSAWLYNAWLTSWFDPDRWVVRLALLVVMLASLVMSAALPEAFGERGLLFAGAYLAIQGGRSVFAVAVLRAESRLRRDVQRIQSWLVASAMLWLAGGLAHGTVREVLWLAAVVVDLGAPACRFYIPRLGRSQTTDWTVTGAHLAERFQLFLMIALGESILVTGVTLGQLPLSGARLTALMVAFGGSAALWWIYLNRSAEDGRAVIARSADPGRLGRVAYTYFHLPMVAGIIVAAVGNELTVTDPRGDADAATIATVVGGPALFLAGHVLFKRALLGVLSVARLVAIAALGVLVPLGWVVSPLVLAVMATLVLVAVAGWDSRVRQAHLPVPPTA
jgi:low temperature requirement protein LtrA